MVYLFATYIYAVVLIYICVSLCFKHVHAHTHTHACSQSAYRIIQFSSPNLNYVIGVGALLLYMRVYFMAIPSTDPTVVAVFCNVRMPTLV